VEVFSRRTGIVAARLPHMIVFEPARPCPVSPVAANSAQEGLASDRRCHDTVAELPDRVIRAGRGDTRLEVATACPVRAAAAGPRVLTVSSL
jgi:hypothetical protein